MNVFYFVFTIQDKIIEEDRKQFRITGGCTAVVAVFFLGKLYVANAGDSRWEEIPDIELGNGFHPSPCLSFGNFTKREMNYWYEM